MKILDLLWQPVKSLLVKISRIQATIIMAVIYLVVIGPMALAYQLFHADTKSPKSYWTKKPRVTNLRENLERQF